MERLGGVLHDRLPRQSLRALPLDGKGDLTDKTIWKRTDVAPYVASPVLVDGLLYLTKGRTGIFYMAEAKTGNIVVDGRRLPGIDSMYASLAAASGKVFLVGRKGTTVVLAAGREFKVLSENKLGEGIDASPVLVGKRIYLRGAKHLYCIEEN